MFYILQNILVTISYIVISNIQEYIEYIPKVGGIVQDVIALTNPSIHCDSLMAPQHPRKPTTIIRAPATMRI